MVAPDAPNRPAEVADIDFSNVDIADVEITVSIREGDFSSTLTLSVEDALHLWRELSETLLQVEAMFSEDR